MGSPAAPSMRSLAIAAASNAASASALAPLVARAISAATPASTLKEKWVGSSKAKK